jgi:long-chain acyl-CoA synthetase
MLSILPLSHMFEQTAGLFIPLAGGASVTYTDSLRPDVIFRTMAARHITNMNCVPQVLQLFRGAIEREIRKQGKYERWDQLHRFALRLPFTVRRLFFRPIHRRMGGAFEFFAAGGAFLDPELARWWEGLGIKVVQGYGMTEASPVVTMNSLAHRDPTSVGRVPHGCEVRIAADGEIVVRGPQITPGYWHNDEATAAALRDGWYHTGDLGYFDAHGGLHLRGRKKNMIALANGMKVYPEDVEQALVAQPGVKEVVVLGLNSGQDIEVHAVLLLDRDGADPDVIVKNANRLLAPHQQVRGYTLWPDETFPLTPTLKIKRADVDARVEALRAEQTSARPA